MTVLLLAGVMSPRAGADDPRDAPATDIPATDIPATDIPATGAPAALPDNAAPPPGPAADPTLPNPRTDLSQAPGTQPEGTPPDGMRPTGTQPSTTQPAGGAEIALPEAPAVRPPTLRASLPLPKLYQCLITRSLFSRGGSAQQASMAAHVAPGAGGGAEAGLVFRGVGVSDDQRSAYLENAASHQITRHAVGESIAGGRIAMLSLDELVFEFGGQTRRILPGQNLAGETVAPPPPPASQPSGPQQPGGPGGPGGPPMPPMPPGMSPEQMAEMQRAMMRSRRGVPMQAAD